jgi:hypothetical protein
MSLAPAPQLSLQLGDIVDWCDVQLCLKAPRASKSAPFAIRKRAAASSSYSAAMTPCCRFKPIINIEIVPVEWRRLQDTVADSMVKHQRLDLVRMYGLLGGMDARSRSFHRLLTRTGPVFTSRAGLES